MAKANEHDLTIDPESLYHGDDDERMHIPEHLVAALTSHLGERAGLSGEQSRRVLSELSAVAREQLAAHPNRFLVIPGVAAIMLERQPPQEKINPFTKAVMKKPGVARLKLKPADELLGAMRGMMRG